MGKGKVFFKRVVSLCMAGLLVVGMTSCNKSTKDVGGKVTLTDPGTYPITKDKMTLKVFTMTMPNVEDLATNDFTKYLEDLTGVHVEFETGGRDDWKDKLNLSLQSGDYADVILGVSPDFSKYGTKENIIIPLDDLLTEKNCPNYMKMFKDQLDLSREADGKIYSLLATNDCYHCSYGRKMWINTKYLENMGVSIPTTTQEFYDVCKKFLEMKPDGIAIAGTAPGAGWFSTFQEYLLGSFMLSPSTSYTLGVRDYTAVDKDGKIQCAAVDDRYKEFLKYCNSLYQLGAIYDGDFTQTEEQLRTIINQEDAPVLCFPVGTISNYIDSAANPELYRQYTTMPPLTGPEGTKLSTNFKYSSIGAGNFCITDKCKNPEAALRWIDFFYSETGDLCSQYGADKGKDWVLNPEGKVGLDGEPALYEVLNSYSPDTQNHDWQDIGIRVAPMKYRMGFAVDPAVDPYSPDGLEKLLYDATKNNYEPYKQNESNSDLDVLPELKLTVDETTNISTVAVEVEKIINESSVSFITGAKDIDSEWDGYKESLKKSGLQDLLKVYQTAYDRMIKN